MDSEEREVLQRAQAGEAAALERLVVLQGSWVRRLMARLAPMGVDSDDLAQDVFVALLERLGSFDTSAGDFRAWVYGIARHVALRAWESTKVRRAHWQPVVEQALQSAGGSPAPAERSDVEQTLSALRDCVRSLGPKARELVDLRYRDRLTFEGIARSLGQNASSVRGTLTRIRALLRDCLEKKGITSLQAEGGES